MRQVSGQAEKKEQQSMKTRFSTMLEKQKGKRHAYFQS